MSDTVGAMSERSEMSLSPQMSAEDAEEYTRSLGQAMSGGWRLIALAQRLGVPEALGMTRDAWVRERIGGYVRLGLDERREAAKALTDPEGEFHLTQRQAAEVLGVGVGTVNRDLGDVPNGTVSVASLEADDGGDVPNGTAEEAAEPGGIGPGAYGEDAHGRRTFYGQPFCADCGEPHDDDESCPEIVTYPTDLGGPTVGDVRDEISAAFDDEAVGAEMAAARHVSEMARVRATWVRFVCERTPGVFARDLDRGGLDHLAGELDRIIDWLQQARAIAVAAKRPRRVV